MQRNIDIEGVTYMERHEEKPSSVVVHMDTDEEWGPRMEGVQISKPIVIELDPEVGSADEWDEALSSWKKQRVDQAQESEDDTAIDPTHQSDNDWGD